MISYNSDGLDDLVKKLEKVSEPQSVPVTDLLNSAFMKQYTKFSTFDEMTDAAQIENEDQLDSPEWNKFVADNTQFENWESMLAKGAEEHLARQLGF